MLRIGSASLFALALIAAPLAYAGDAGDPGDQEMDQVIRRDSPTPLSLKITKDDWIGIEGKIKTQTTKVKSAAVKEVLYSDRVPEYLDGLEYFRNQKYVAAARNFLKALEKLKEKSKWSVEYCNYFIGEALYNQGKFEVWKDSKGIEYQPPSAYFLEVVKANGGRSRFAPEAAIRAAASLAEEGKLDEAEKQATEADKVIKKWKEEVNAADPEAYTKAVKRVETLVAIARAHILERREDAKANEAERDYGKAIAAYRAAESLSKTNAFGDLYTDVIETTLFLLANASKWDDVKSRAQALMEDYKRKPDTTLLNLLPSAYIARGRAFLAEAVQYTKDGNIPQANESYANARLDFLSVTVQFFDKEEHLPEANYRAGACYEQLKALEPDAAEKAVRHYKIVSTQYASNKRFKDLADEGLKRLGAADAAAGGGGDAPKPKDPKDAPKPTPAPAPK